jgi:hypothetical protein
MHLDTLYYINGEFSFNKIDGVKGEKQKSHPTVYLKEKVTA